MEKEEEEEVVEDDDADVEEDADSDDVDGGRMICFRKIISVYTTLPQTNKHFDLVCVCLRKLETSTRVDGIEQLWVSSLLALVTYSPILINTCYAMRKQTRTHTRTNTHSTHTNRQTDTHRNRDLVLEI